MITNGSKSPSGSYLEAKNQNMSRYGATYKSLLWHITYNVILTYNIDIEK